MKKRFIIAPSMLLLIGLLLPLVSAKKIESSTAEITQKKPAQAATDFFKNILIKH